MCKVLQTSFATLLFERVHAVRETVDEPEQAELGSDLELKVDL